MKKRKVTAMAISGIGAVLSLLALYAASYVAGIKGALSSFTRVFSDNKVGGFLSGEMNRQASAYDGLIVGCFWSGIAIFIAGLVMIIMNRKNKGR